QTCALPISIPLCIGDMTARKHTELSLAERERYWTQMLRALPDAIYVLSIPGRRPLFSNQRLGELLGYPETELFSRWRKDPLALIHPRSEEHTSELQSRENLVCRL